MSIFNSLKLRTLQEAGRYAFQKGYGGPLLFIWILGAGVLAVYLEHVFLAILWTAVVFVIFFFLTWDYLKNPKIEKEIVREAVEGYFENSEQDIENIGIKGELKKAQKIYAEIICKVREIIKEKGAGNLERVLDNANKMIALQKESAKQVDELERFLSVTDDREAKGSEQELLLENISASKAELTKARNMVYTLTNKLRTLLLQIPQIEKNAGDLVEASDIEKNIEKELARIQMAIRATKETVKKFTG